MPAKQRYASHTVNYTADHMRDAALGVHSFRRQLKIVLFIYVTHNVSLNLYYFLLTHLLMFG